MTYQEFSFSKDDILRVSSVRPGWENWGTFLESDLQGSSTLCDEFLLILKFGGEFTGNGYNVIVHNDTVDIENLFLEDTGTEGSPRLEVIGLVTAWKEFILSLSS